MKRSDSSQSSVLRQAKSAPRAWACIVAVVLVLMPFHATLTVWLSQAVGHYLGLRLWKEYLLIVLGIGVLWLLAHDADTRRRFLRSKLVWLIGGYLGIQVFWGVAAFFAHHATGKALLYGWISDSRYLVFFMEVWVLARRAPQLTRVWPRLIMWPAVAVIIFGMLQYFVLPYDVMKHFGYSAATIFPYEDINHNIAYIRIMSSLRGANPLGAYMVMILSLLAALLVRRRTKTLSKWKYSAALVLFILLLGAVVLILTFSRSAWVGLAVSMAALLWVSIRAQRTRLAVLVGAAVVVVGGAGAVCGLRNDTTFQNIFFHTQTNSVVKTTSNEGHVAAFRTGIDDIVREPFGRGPGTAGPASLYNTGHPGRIAENYFLQIGQETGWIGLAVFVMINVLIARSLWRRRDDALAAGLLASLIGISCIGLFSHVWADDTLAYIWWGLAALAYATRLPHLDDISKM